MMGSLRFRLTLWFSLAVTVTAAAAAWIGHLFVERRMMEGIDFLLAAEIQEIVDRIGPDPALLTAVEVVARVEGHTQIDAPLYYFQIRRTGQGLVFRSHNLGEAVLPDFPDGGGSVRTVDWQGMPVRQRERSHHGFRVQVATNLEQVEALLDRHRHSLLVGMPVLFGASLAGGWLLSRVALQPVRAMQRSAQRISAHNLSERLPVPHGADEIAAFARLLNDLFARLEASFEQVKRFTADASHELKTPLSLLRLHAERLGRSPRLGDAERAEIEGQLEEIGRLNRLIENLLLLAKADAGGLRPDKRRGDCARFVAEFGEDAGALAEEAGVRFAITRNDAGEAEFDPGFLRQVLLNVITNSVRVSPAQRHVALASTIEGSDWLLTIDDEGPGVPPEQLEAIFRRFMRLPATGERTGGSGLGLAIARSMIEAHGGTIAAENRASGGLRVTVRLRAAAARVGISAPARG